MSEHRSQTCHWLIAQELPTEEKPNWSVLKLIRTNYVFFFGHILSLSFSSVCTTFISQWRTVYNVNCEWASECATSLIVPMCREYLINACRWRNNAAKGKWFNDIGWLYCSAVYIVNLKRKPSWKGTQTSQYLNISISHKEWDRGCVLFLCLLLPFAVVVELFLLLFFLNRHRMT